jgi:hypothetical protein
MNLFRVTVKGAEGTSYSWVESSDDWDPAPTCGEWFAPFPNKAGEDTTAYGVVEMFMQSDECPQRIHDEGVVWVSIREAD